MRLGDKPKRLVVVESSEAGGKIYKMECNSDVDKRDWRRFSPRCSEIMTASSSLGSTYTHMENLSRRTRDLAPGTSKYFR